MAIWRGLGLLAVFIAAAMVAAVGFVAQFIGIEDTDRWPEALALLLAGIVVWFLGRALHSHAEASWADTSMKPVMLHDSIQTVSEEHSLLFIRMEYWGPIYVAAGVLTLFFS